MSLTVRTLAGDELRGALGDLARLRIAVFAAYPYLYHGSEAYERDYLAEFTAAPDAVLIAAFDGARIVGAATASPLAGQDDYIREPFGRAGIDGRSCCTPDLAGEPAGNLGLERRHIDRLGRNVADLLDGAQALEHIAK